MLVAKTVDSRYKFLPSSQEDLILNTRAIDKLNQCVHERRNQLESSIIREDIVAQRVDYFDEDTHDLVDQVNRRNFAVLHVLERRFIRVLHLLAKEQLSRSEAVFAHGVEEHQQVVHFVFLPEVLEVVVFLFNIVSNVDVDFLRQKVVGLVLMGVVCHNIRLYELGLRTHLYLVK